MVSHHRTEPLTHAVPVPEKQPPCHPVDPKLPSGDPAHLYRAGHDTPNLPKQNEGRLSTWPPTEPQAHE